MVYRSTGRKPVPVLSVKSGKEMTDATRDNFGREVGRKGSSVRAGMR